MNGHLCSFSALDALKARDRSSGDKVLAALRANGGRFSVFEVDGRLARTLDALKREGRLWYPEPQPGYPWNRVEVYDRDMRCRATYAARSRDGMQIVPVQCMEFAPDGKHCPKHAKVPNA